MDADANAAIAIIVNMAAAVDLMTVVGLKAMI